MDDPDSTRLAEPQIPPAEGQAPALLDRLVNETQRSTATTAASGGAAINGGLHFLAALQLWSAVWLAGPYRAVPYLMVGLGICFVALGSRIYGQRLWAVRLTIFLSVVDGLAMGLWLLLAAGSGIFSPLLTVLPAGSVGAFVLALFAHGSCARTAAARRRAAASGLDIDL